MIFFILKIKRKIYVLQILQMAEWCCCNTVNKFWNFYSCIISAKYLPKISAKISSEFVINTFIKITPAKYADQLSILTSKIRRSTKYADQPRAVQESFTHQNWCFLSIRIVLIGKNFCKTSKYKIFFNVILPLYIWNLSQS